MVIHKTVQCHPTASDLVGKEYSREGLADGADLVKCASTRRLSCVQIASAQSDDRLLAVCNHHHGGTDERRLPHDSLKFRTNPSNQLRIATRVDPDRSPQPTDVGLQANDE